MNKKDFFENLKLSLESLENKLTLSDCEENYTNIFILGLPRSGTTLLSQIIHNATNCSAPNNFIARFWDAPLVGAHLSKFTVKKDSNRLKAEDYESFFGQTNGISQPHEYSFFWQNNMGYSLNDNGLLRRIGEPDLDRLKNKIVNFNHIFEGPAVWKPLELILYDIESISRRFEKGIFVFIDRSYRDIALSIHDARMKSNDPYCWWGSAPLEQDLPNTVKFSVNNQITYQIDYFRKMYKEKLGDVDSRRMVTIRFDDMCQNPNYLLEKIKNLSDKLDGKLQIESELKPFVRKKRKHKCSESAQLLNQLDVLFGNQEYLFDA